MYRIVEIGEPIGEATGGLAVALTVHKKKLGRRGKKRFEPLNKSISLEIYRGGCEALRICWGEKLKLRRDVER